VIDSLLQEFQIENDSSKKSRKERIFIQKSG